MLLSILFSPHLEQNTYTLSSTLLDCPVNILSNVSAAIAYFTKTQGTGLDDFSSTSSKLRMELFMSSSVRISETV